MDAPALTILGGHHVANFDLRELCERYQARDHLVQADAEGVDLEGVVQTTQHQSCFQC